MKVSIIVALALLATIAFAAPQFEPVGMLAMLAKMAKAIDLTVVPKRMPGSPAPPVPATDFSGTGFVIQNTSFTNTTGPVDEYMALSKNMSLIVTDFSINGYGTKAEYLDRYDFPTPTQYFVTMPAGISPICEQTSLPFAMHSPWIVLMGMTYQGEVTRGGVKASAWGASTPASTLQIGFDPKSPNTPVWLYSGTAVEDSFVSIDSFTVGTPAASTFTVPTACVA
eukprot:c1303_g1_i1.p1 GENE.c1303_g1_i1~~c1303_g1_i1.p1  ORF type:complete len:234 (+),score=56.18 c1303_g1_i1:28-702(+)